MEQAYPRRQAMRSNVVSDYPWQCCAASSGSWRTLHIATTGSRHSPPPSTPGKAGRNPLNEKTTPLLPAGISERFSQTISNLGHAALLRRCELPLSALRFQQALQA
jgi:hypothetical protein